MRIEQQHLESNARIERLYLHAVNNGWWPKGAQHFRDYIALAEYAIRKAEGYEKVGSLFVWLIKNDARDRISQTDEDKAYERWKEITYV